MFTQSFFRQFAFYDNGKTGHAIVFLHGLGAGASYGEFLTHVYPDNRIILVDLPGHGASPFKEGEIDIYKIAIELSALFEHCKVVQPVLCGHSLGAQIALLSDIVHPYLSSRLILISPAGLETFNAMQKQSIVSSLQFGNFLQQLFVPKIKNIMPQAVDVFPSPKIISAYIQSMLDRPVNDLLDRITCKSTVIFGENDYIIPNRLFNMEAAVPFAKSVLGAHANFTVLSLSNSGHWPMTENPIGLIKLLKEKVPRVEP